MIIKKVIIVMISMHTFAPIAIATSAAWNNKDTEILQEIGKRITLITSDLKEINYLFQRISTAAQWGNYLSFFSSC